MKRLRLAWKVNGLFLLILAAALGISRFLTNLDLERAEISTAREISIATSERILTRLRGIMVSHQANELASVVNRMASENPAFRDVRLITHRGEVVASQLEAGPSHGAMESWPCTVCQLRRRRNHLCHDGDLLRRVGVSTTTSVPFQW